MKHLLTIAFALVFSVSLVGSVQAAAIPPDCVEDALGKPYDDALVDLRTVCLEPDLANEIEARYDRLVDINDGFVAGFTDDALKAFALNNTDSDVDDFEVAQQAACVTRALDETYTTAIAQLNDNCNSSVLADEIVARYDRLVTINTNFIAGFSNAALQAFALTSTDAAVDTFEVDQRELCIDRAFTETYTLALVRLNDNCDASDIADALEARFDRLVDINDLYGTGYSLSELQDFALSYTDADVDDLEAELASIEASFDDTPVTSPTSSLGPGTGLEHLAPDPACPDPVANIDISAIHAEVLQACSFAGVSCPGSLLSMVTTAVNDARVDAIEMCEELYPSTIVHDIYSILGLAPPTVIPYSGNPVSDADLAAAQAQDLADAEDDSDDAIADALAEASARAAAAGVTLP